MALESTTYINGLVATNPTGTDPKSQGDDHIRLVKSAIKNTLPNITGAVTATQDELNLLDGVTATTAELNKIDGYTGSNTELNYAKDLYDTGVTATEFDKLDGVTLALSFLNGMTGGVKDEDNMTSNSASSLATQQSIKAYVDSQSPELYFGGGTATSGTDFTIRYGATGSCFVIGFGGRRATYGNFGDNTLQLRDGSTSVDSVTFRTIEYDSRLSSGSAVVMKNFTGGTAGATKTNVDLYWSAARGNEDYIRYFYVGY